MPTSTEITSLLKDWSGGDQSAFDRLFTLVYEELRVMASRYMQRERVDHTLQTTALVNEAYIRLASQTDAPWQNRLHFFAVAAKVMRHILVDHARAQRSAKRGGGAEKISLDEADVISQGRALELIALDDALKELVQLDPRQAQVVELRYFGGLTLEEVAQFLKVSSDTVTRDWNSAKAWLYQKIRS